MRQPGGTPSRVRWGFGREPLRWVTAVIDESARLERGYADAASAAPSQLRRVGPCVSGPVVGPNDGDERRQRELCAASEADVSREPLLDGDSSAGNVKHVDDALNVRLGRRVVTLDCVGSCRLDGQPRLVDGKPDTAIEALVGEREVLKSEMKSRSGRDRRQTASEVPDGNEPAYRVLLSPCEASSRANVDFRVPWPR